MTKEEVLRLINNSYEEEKSHIGVIGLKYVVETADGYELSKYEHQATECFTIKHLKEVAPDAKIFTIIRRKELKNYE